MALIIEFSCLLLTILCVTGVPIDQTTNNATKSNISNQTMKLTKYHHLPLKLHYLRNKNVTCNDGTTAGYYLKRSHQSKDWIIYLEGGWYCFSDQSCAARLSSNMNELMSSTYWYPKRAGVGILSSNPEFNPTWWNANHVLVPYCSSDAWSGNVSRSESGGNFSFMGYRIINEVIKELLTKGLVSSQRILIAGSSAGGIGVIMNIDRIADMLTTAGSTAVVRGLSDSGWYIDRKTSRCKINPTSKDCFKISDVIGKGMSYWKGVVPEKCAEKFPSKPWKCYFGHNIYKTLKSPLFIFQWQYDGTQLIVENLPSGLPTGTNLIQNVFKLARDVTVSLKRAHVSGVFIPACISHTTLTDNNWLRVKVHEQSLDNAINCWITKDNLKTSSPESPPINCQFIDTCGFPQCNCWCPIPRDPFTGKIFRAQPRLQLHGISVNPKKLMNLHPCLYNKMHSG